MPAKEIAFRMTKRRGTTVKKPVVIIPNLVRNVPKVPIKAISQEKSFAKRLANIPNEIDVDTEDLPDDLADSWDDIEDDFKKTSVKKNWAIWLAMFTPFILPAFVKGVAGDVELPFDAKQSVQTNAPDPKQIVDYAKQYFRDRGLSLVTTLSQTDCEHLKEQMLANWGKGPDAFKAAFQEDYANTAARLDVIYRSEYVKAQNEGILARAQDSNQAYKQWNCALTERSCPTCSNLHLQIVPIDEDFEDTDGISSPPYHPNCMCVLTTLSQEDYDDMSGEEQRQDAAYLSDAFETIKLNYNFPADEKVGSGPDCQNAAYLAEVSDFMKFNLKCKAGTVDEGNSCQPNNKEYHPLKTDDNHLIPHISISKANSYLKEHVLIGKDKILTEVIPDKSKQLLAELKVVNSNTLSDIPSTAVGVTTRGANFSAVVSFREGMSGVGLHELGHAIQRPVMGENGKLIYSPLSIVDERLHETLINEIKESGLKYPYIDTKNNVESFADLFASYSNPREVLHLKYGAPKTFDEAKSLFGESPFDIEIGDHVKDYITHSAKDGLIENFRRLQRDGYKTDLLYKVDDLILPETGGKPFTKKEISSFSGRMKEAEKMLSSKGTIEKQNIAYLADATEFIKLNYKCKREDSPDGSNKCGLEGKEESNPTNNNDLTVISEANQFGGTTFKLQDKKGNIISISPNKSDIDKIVTRLTQKDSSITSTSKQTSSSTNFIGFKADHDFSSKQDREANMKVQAALDKAALPLKSFSSEDKNALRGYTGHNFEQINDYLSGSMEKNDPNNTIMMQDSKELVTEIDKLFDNAELQDPLITYRGVKDDIMVRYPELRDALDTPGSQVQFPCFTSTSALPFQANRFAEGYSGRLLELQLPKGTKALFIAEESGVPQEMEVLVNRGIKFEVGETKYTDVVTPEKGKKTVNRIKVTTIKAIV